MGKMWHFDCFRLGEPKILVCMASMGPRIGNGCFKFLYEVLILDQEIHINIPLVKICLFCSAYQTWIKTRFCYSMYIVVYRYLQWKFYHSIVFIPMYRCSTCRVSLPEDYYEEKDLPYCREHFYERSARKCHRCHDYITGPTMVRRWVYEAEGEGRREGAVDYTLFILDTLMCFNFLMVWGWGNLFILHAMAIVKCFCSSYIRQSIVLSLEVR